MGYTELVHRVVRESPEPLAFAEVFQRVHAMHPVTTNNPRGTIRGAITRSQLIMSVGDGRYGWKPRLINGSVLRIELREADIQGPFVEITDEVRDALWPGFFADKKHNDRAPVSVCLPDGSRVDFALEHLEKSRWGAAPSPPFWTWLKSVRPAPGDALHVKVLDGNARQYAVSFERRADRDDAAVAARNGQILQASLRFFREKVNGAAIWDLAAHLLVTGCYRDQVPPDALEQIWTRDIWEPELKKKPPPRYVWAPIERAPNDPLVQSLRGEVGRSRKRVGTTASAMSTTGSVYQFKVALRDTRPAVWRRVAVPGDITLASLHAVLQVAMGWTHSHLHRFDVADVAYGRPLPDLQDELPMEDDRTTELDRVILAKKGAHFTYTYDFGDDWVHDLVVEEVAPPEAGVSYPCVLDGARACPPEDVGGTPGYENFLHAIRDRKHPEHEDMMEWIGGRFDPEKFDVAKANRRLRLLFAPKR